MSMRARLRRLWLCRIRDRHDWKTTGYLVERTKAVADPSPDDEEGPPWSVGDQVDVYPIQECQRCGRGAGDNPTWTLEGVGS